METERSGFERQQRLYSERLDLISEHAIHQLSDTDPQLIVELQNNELVALSYRRESEQSAFAQFQAEQRRVVHWLCNMNSSSFEKQMVFCKVLKLS